MPLNLDEQILKLCVHRREHAGIAYLTSSALSHWRTAMLQRTAVHAVKCASAIFPRAVRKYYRQYLKDYVQSVSTTAIEDATFTHTGISAYRLYGCHETELLPISLSLHNLERSSLDLAAG